jgi:ornithine cyclodeaminase
MTTVYRLDQIKEIIKKIDISKQLEEGFVLYTNNKVIVPPVGEMIFEDPPGDTHIKYGFIEKDDYFVVKIASGFYENHKIGLPSSTGVMLLFSQKSGELISILIDEGYLTDIRTAIAGGIVAKYLSPKKISFIGVLGTGVQARLQVEYLKGVTDCRNIVVYGRTEKKLKEYKKEMESKGYLVEITSDTSVVTSKCNMIITATPSSKALINFDQLLPGTHITAMGSDTPQKQELNTDILEKADIVVTDSKEQSLSRGEIYRAIKDGKMSKEKIVELGEVILNPSIGRTSDTQLTVADLTGVAVQDIQITKAVYKELQKIIEKNN